MLHSKSAEFEVIIRSENESTGENEGRLSFLKFHAEHADASDHPAAESLSTRLGASEIVNWLPSFLALPHTLIIAHQVMDGCVHPFSILRQTPLCISAA